MCILCSDALLISYENLQVNKAMNTFNFRIHFLNNKKVLLPSTASLFSRAVVFFLVVSYKIDVSQFEEVYTFAENSQ